MSETWYDHIAVEEKWQKFWEENHFFQQTEAQRADNPSDKEYLLFAFAYPSGAGLHVGHVESKTALDILARFNRMRGQNVFFPVGWDAFGLPAENYAIKTGVHPAETTVSAIKTFRRQIKRLGISYDWANEVATSHPEYYKWTQWIFLQLFRKGLAYQATAPVNWCPSCQTVLANEQVVNSECERCGSEVIQKEMKQWFFKITEYQDELINGLDQVDWPSATKQHQLNWIGRSAGIRITFEVIDSDETIDVFTTAPTNWGASFMVLAPEHPVIEKIVTSDQREAVDAYLEEVKSKSESERTRTNEKTGVFTGAYVKNHVTGKNIPVWISDFVLMHVGTGAIQGCPGHDQRDFEFAKKFGIAIPRVVVGPDGDTGPIETANQVIDKTMPGKMINSEFLDGIEYKEALQKTMDYFVEQGWGKRVVTYKLRDWLISRQRYWGTPIPVVYDPDGNPHPVKAEHLPWELPTDVDFKPTGESPLRSSKEFVERTERLYGKGWRPEYDTMDTFVDSSWYFLRYVDARNPSEFASSSQIKQWLPVDLYMIGPEHIVLHLLYARFFTKFLRDEGYFEFDEPFMKMRHQGMILGPDGKKMSKSKGNVINPDEIIEKFGADTLRVYEMFMGPLEADKPWDTRAVIGVHKFLQRIYRMAQASLKADVQTTPALEQELHQTIKKVTQDIPKLKFNTAIAAMMEFVNAWESEKHLSVADLGLVVRLLAPFSPFLADELYSQIDAKADQSSGKSSNITSVHLSEWPTWDESIARESEVTIAVQINGKVRAEITGPQDQMTEKVVIERAKANPRIQQRIADKKIIKEIYIPGKILNLVVV